MKSFYLAVAGFCFAIPGYSQTNDTIVRKIARGYEDRWPHLLINSKLLAENKGGKIYTLPLDNIHCMVPNLKNITPVPTKKLYPCDSKMPNKNP